MSAFFSFLIIEINVISYIKFILKKSIYKSTFLNIILLSTNVILEGFIIIYNHFYQDLI